MTDKSKGARVASGAESAPAGEDHIVANLRHLFKGFEQEELPERFRALLEELAKKERS